MSEKFPFDKIVVRASDAAGALRAAQEIAAERGQTVTSEPTPTGAFDGRFPRVKLWRVSVAPATITVRAADAEGALRTAGEIAAERGQTVTSEPTPTGAVDGRFPRVKLWEVGLAPATEELKKSRLRLSRLD